jgi:hypothetical protein
MSSPSFRPLCAHSAQEISTQSWPLLAEDRSVRLRRFGVHAVALDRWRFPRSRVVVEPGRAKAGACARIAIAVVRVEAGGSRRAT